MSASGQERQVIEGHQNWRVIRDLDTDTFTLEVINDNGIYQLEDIDLTVQRKTQEWYSYQDDDFSSAKGQTLWARSFQRGDWQVKTIARTKLSCDDENLYMGAELDAYEGDSRVY